MAGALKTLVAMLSTAPSMAGVNVIFGEEQEAQVIPTTPAVFIVPLGGLWDQPGYVHGLDPTNETLWGTRERLDIYCWAADSNATAQPIDHADAVETLRVNVLQAFQNQRHGSGADGNNGGGLFYKPITGRWQLFGNAVTRYGRCYVLTVEVEISVSDVQPVNATITAITANMSVQADAWTTAVAALGPSAWYRMDATSSDSSIPDNAGFSQSLPISPGSWTSSPSLIASNPLGKSMFNDGFEITSNDNAWTITDEFTLFWWFLHSQSVNFTGAGYDSIGHQTDGLAFDLVGTGGHATATARVSFNGSTLGSVPSVDISRKRMVALTGDLSVGTWSLLLDGVLVKNGANWTNGQPWRGFGINTLFGGSGSFGCTYDEIVMVRGIMSPQALQGLYRLG